MSSLTVRPVAGSSSPVDGRVARSGGGVNETFSTIRAGAGTLALDNEASGLIGLDASATPSQYNGLNRLILCFDASSIPDDSTITAATLRVRGVFKTNGLGSADMHVVSATPASTSALVNSDYGNTGTVSFGSVSYASFSDSAYNDISLNASGFTTISKTGITCFGLRTSWDQSGSFGGVWASLASTQLWISMADEAGTTQDPELVITYFPNISPGLTLMGVG